MCANQVLGDLILLRATEWYGEGKRKVVLRVGKWIGLAVQLFGGWGG